MYIKNKNLKINVKDVEFFKKHNIKKYEHKGAINIDVHLGGFEITPIGRNKCLLKGITNINPKFDWLPNNIMNWVLKKVEFLN